MVDYSTTADVIRQIESSGNRFACRFEYLVYKNVFSYSTAPEHDALIARIAHRNLCDHATARMIYSTSWGWYQIMGFNLYRSEIDLQMSVFSYMNEDKQQNDAFSKFIQNANINFTLDQLRDKNNREKFALVYNGSVSYASKIAAYL